MANHLRIKEVSKNFSGVPALKQVDLELYGGRVHALLGANGAGKSTLMKILAGAYLSDTGQIYLNGDEVLISSPEYAQRHGIHIVYQEVDTAIIPTLSVSENIMLSAITHNSRVLMRWGKFAKQAEKLAQQVGLDITLNQSAARLSLAQKQLVLIARALSQEARFIILDEPTAPLSKQESERLYILIEQLKAKGVGIVFISHRLDEVFQISDHITVLRDGEHIFTRPTGKTSINEVIQTMLGKTFSQNGKRQPAPKGEKILDVRNIKSQKVKDFSLQLNRGEVIGIYGMVGAGKTEAARLIFQADQRQAGTVQVKDTSLANQATHTSVAAGIALIPEERRKDGLITNDGIRLNLTLPSLKKWTSFSFINRNKEEEQAQNVRQKLNIKSSHVNQNVKTLSGGNQQKVVIGKWLLADSEIYIFDEPTKGIDVGAKQEVIQLIDQLAHQGKGILYFSSELDEIVTVADHIVIMFEGRIVKELNQNEATREKLLYYASGGQECAE